MGDRLEHLLAQPFGPTGWRALFWQAPQDKPGHPERLQQPAVVMIERRAEGVILKPGTYHPLVHASVS